MQASLYDFHCKTADGSMKSLADYTGQVLLIVNTASLCGFTKQYEGLQQLQQNYHDQGFSVLAFPCNQFGGQEPGSDEEVQNFCDTCYHVTFPVFAKIKVNGDEADPLFKYLKAHAPGVLGTEAIKWNFTKFLINRQGEVVERFAPKDEPASLMPVIESLLPASDTWLA